METHTYILVFAIAVAFAATAIAAAVVHHSDFVYFIIIGSIKNCDDTHTHIYAVALQRKWNKTKIEQTLSRWM